MDGDLSSYTVYDTPPDVGIDYFTKKGWNPADPSIEITIKSVPEGINFTFNPDRYNVMSYYFCDDTVRITVDQVRRIREWLLQDHRKSLITGQI